MKRLLPSPALSAALLGAWLLLQQSIAPAQLLLGSLLAVLGPLLVRPLQQHPPARIRSLPALGWLLAMVVIEITRSTFNVARIILGIRTRGINSQFVRIPLEMRSPYGLAVLAGIINTTPGTVWVEILPDSGDLLLHVFDLHDEQWWIDTIKSRYEKPLMDLFEADSSDSFETDSSDSPGDRR